MNVLVVRYESKEGRRLNSQILGVDAKHTHSDVWTTSAVLAALLWRVARVSADSIRSPASSWRVFIGHACWQIAKDASGVLADQIVIAGKKTSDRWWTQRLASSGAKKIRTRGPADSVFVDLHL